MVDPAAGELTDLLHCGVKDAFAADLRHYGRTSPAARAAAAAGVGRGQWAASPRRCGSH
jgi:hypothetical protein